MANFDSQVLQNAVNGAVQLPWNIVYDCGSIHRYVNEIWFQVVDLTLFRLPEYLAQARNGLQINEIDGTLEMLALVERFSQFEVSLNGASCARLNSNSEKRGPQFVVRFSPAMAVFC